MKGSFPTEPMRVYFDLDFIPSDSEWKLIESTSRSGIHRRDGVLLTGKKHDPQRMPPFDFGLGETADALRDQVRASPPTRSRRSPPRSTRRPIPARAVAGDGRARPARHHRRGGVRRLGPRLSRACRRDGGGEPRLGLGRPLLRRALQPLRQPDPPQRHRRAEAQLPAEADLRRACRRAGDERTGRRLRRRRR